MVQKTQMRWRLKVRVILMIKFNLKLEFVQSLRGNAQRMPLSKTCQNFSPLQKKKSENVKYQFAFIYAKKTKTN